MKPSELIKLKGWGQDAFAINEKTGEECDPSAPPCQPEGWRNFCLLGACYATLPVGDSAGAFERAIEKRLLPHALGLGIVDEGEMIFDVVGFNDANTTTKEQIVQLLEAAGL